jgi:hypothetical protein
VTTGPSYDFVAQVGPVLERLRTQYPDARARDALAGEPIIVYGTPEPWHWHMVGRPQPLGYEVMLGMHMGAGGAPLSDQAIMVFEDGVRRAAAAKGIPVDWQVEETLLHEAEHALGYCPPGHTDCSPDEIARTLAAGGTLDPTQLAAAGVTAAHMVRGQVRACG